MPQSFKLESPDLGVVSYLWGGSTVVDFLFWLGKNGGKFKRLAEEGSLKDTASLSTFLKRKIKEKKLTGSPKEGALLLLEIVGDGFEDETITLLS